MKVCTKCNEQKPLNAFGKAKAKFSISFHAEIKDEYKNVCKSCLAAEARDWRAKHPGYDGTGRFAKFPKEDRKLVSAICARLNEAKQRIRKFSKVETNLTIEYLYDLFKQQEGKCAMTGEKLEISKGSPVSLSLDQIEPNKGYLVGNVQWLAWAVNRAKGDLDSDTFIRMCERVSERATTTEKQHS